MKTTSLSCSTLKSSSFDIIEIEKPIREPVDENHPIVLELIDADYPLERSIYAVTKCGMLKDALKFLDDEEEDKDDVGLIPTTYKHQFSGEDDYYHNFMPEWYYSRNIE